MKTTRLDVHRQNRVRTFLILAPLCLTLVAGGCAGPPVAPPPAPPQVTVAVPIVRDVTLFKEFTGTTEAVESVRIRARVQGFLQKINFEPSSFVRKGDLLFVIEQAPYIAALERAKANTKAAEAGLRRTESDLDRLEQAIKTNAVSEQEVTRARAERDQAAAAVLEAEAMLTTAEINLGYTAIKSPVSGLISRNLVDKGNLVGAGETTLLATVRRINPIFAYFQVNERFIARALEDQGGHKGPETSETDLPATLILKETGREVEGEVDSIDNTVDPATGTIQLRAVFDNPKALLFPGFFVHIRLPGETLENALLVEEVALGTDLGGRYLMIVGADNVVEKRYITPGTLEEGGKRVVLEGIEPGEQYILKGLQRTRPGMPVNPTGEHREDRGAARGRKAVGMFSRFFIYRPIFASVIAIVIVLVGVVSIPLLPIESMPDITPPSVKVSTSYPGAGASVVAETVAAPMEEKINGVENMLYMSSKSAADGSCNITVTFEVGTDIDMATVLVQNRVNEALPVLPEETTRQGVKVEKQSTSMTLMVNMISPDGRFDELYISNYTTTRIKDVLARVNGVSKVEVMGAKDFGMRIWIHPDKLRARDLTTMDLTNALREQNVQVAAGQIGGQPAPKDQPFEYSISTLGRLQTVEQFENIIVKRGDAGQLVRVRDVARVELGAQSYNWFATLDGAPSIAIGIYPAPGANALNVADGIKEQMNTLGADFPEGLEYTILYDTTDYIMQSLKEVVTTLIIAVLLVVFTVFVFLQDFRTTLVPAITIPVSLLGTFAVMLALGMSINGLTMFGLILVIGIVVDDAIVVVENTMRLIDDEGLDAKEATAKSMLEITGPVVATTLVLLAVFVPTIVMPGITGRLYRPFAITISIATLFSSLNALTLSPALCGMLLRPSKERTKGFFGIFNRVLDSGTKGYSSVVGLLLRRAAFTLVIFAGLLVATYFGMTSMPAGFVPSEDEGYFMVAVQLPDAASLGRTELVLEDVTAILDEAPGIRGAVVIGGFSLLDSVVSSNAGAVWVVLDHWDDRSTPETQIQSIVDSLNRKFSSFEDAIVFAVRPPPIQGLGSTGGFQMELQDIGGGGLELLQQVAYDLIEQGRQHPVLTQMNTTFRSGVPQLFLEVDREKAKTLDVPLSVIFNTLQANLGSAYVNDFNLFGRVWKVQIQADEEFRTERADIGRLEVRSNSGKMVPLATLLKVEDTVGPTVESRYNLYPSASVTGDAAAGFSSGQSISTMEEIAKNTLPPSMSYEWTGVTYQQLAAGGAAAFIFTLAIIFVYLFLAAQYESWALPFGVVLSVPIAILGASMLTLLRGLDNNVYTQIGFVLLIGLSAKNAILIVEFANQLRQEGKTAFESAMQAARLRFRPILMTALSFILGVTPLLIATGAGAASRVALGTAVFGGMVFATVFGVFVIPWLYFVVQSTSERFSSPKGDDPSVRVDTAEIEVP